MKIPWIKHPRSGKPDTMLTVAIASVIVVLGKVLLNGVSVELFGSPIALGVIDAGLVAALLTPTLGVYAARKYSDSPDKKGKK